MSVIDRQTAIEAFRPYAEYESNRSNKEWVRRIETILSELPSAEPDRKTEWILCKDQMPPMDTYVLAVLDDRHTITIAQRYNDNEWFTHEDECNATDEDVLAWMPLPSPPKN